MTAIDTSFDFRTDAGGKDPDSYSPTLRRYHQILWSKELPCGKLFSLSNKIPGAYLCHSSDLGEHILSSDSIIPTFTRWKSMAHITSQISESENEEFRKYSYSIGGFILFPAKQVERKNTINQARGITRAISDRMDLTLECVRRHYLDIKSPLSETFDRYRSFFELFTDFQGYVDFFFLNDLLEMGSNVRFHLPFDDFGGPAVPTSLDLYLAYRDSTINFVKNRNDRIAKAS